MSKTGKVTKYHPEFLKEIDQAIGELTQDRHWVIARQIYLKIDPSTADKPVCKISSTLRKALGQRFKALGFVKAERISSLDGSRALVWLRESKRHLVPYTLEF